MPAYTLLPSGIYAIGTTTGNGVSIPAGGARARLYVDMGIVVALTVTVMSHESFDGGVTWRDLVGFATVLGNPLPAAEINWDGRARLVRARYTVNGLATSAIKLDVN